MFDHKETDNEQDRRKHGQRHREEVERNFQATPPSGVLSRDDVGVLSDHLLRNHIHPREEVDDI